MAQSPTSDDDLALRYPLLTSEEVLQIGGRVKHPLVRDEGAWSHIDQKIQEGNLVEKHEEKQLKLPPKTQLVQKRIRSPEDSIGVFGSVANADVIPLVLIPDGRIFCSPWFRVPSGVYCVEHVFGKSQKDLAFAGKHWALACHRIAYCVAQQACTYSAPVNQCPTADDVMVDVNMKLVFVIGPSADAVKSFVYTLGAARFDEFLYASLQEAIRILVRSTYHNEIRELRGSDHPRVKETLVGINKQFEQFGVHFSSAVITDVIFSHEELTYTLQETTEFRAKLREHTKAIEFQLGKVQYSTEQQKNRMAAQHRLAIQDLLAKREREKLKRGKLLTQARDRYQVAKTKALEQAQQGEMTAVAGGKAAKTRAQAEKHALLQKGEDQTRVIRARQLAANKVYEAEQQLLATKQYLEAVKHEAKAESEAAAIMKFQRAHELRIKKYSALQDLGSNSKMVVSGSHGDKLIGSILSDSLLDLK